SLFPAGAGTMMAILRTSLILALLVALAARAEDPKPAASSKDDPAKPAEKKAGPLSLDGLKLLPGSVVVLCEDVKDALRLVPKAVVLTPEKYQELLDQIEQLKRQIKPDKADLPSACRLSGQADGDLVRLRARYEFRTDRPKALVVLGGARAWPLSATLD